MSHGLIDKLCIFRLFDSLNSRPRGTGFKAPLRMNFKRFWGPLFTKSKQYLLSLKRKLKSDKVERQLLETKRGTCVRGLIICITSIEMIMKEIVAEECSDLT